MAEVLEHLRSALGDRYDVERLLGEGGMATVFLAKDLRHGRQVAIKTLRAELAASIGADRFLREIRLAANLQHPNILALYDSGEADGVLYYVMPFIEGESLRGRLNREQQLPLHDAVRITREAAEGLAYAHEQGVVHRDIKPENILLQNGHALVADFGIARAVDSASEKLTQTGMAVGTPHYMSPEQSLGADHADGRSDIYSLGCVLYELLVGQPPFDGPNSRAIMARHSMEQVPSLQIVRQSVPDELEDVVLQSLEKTPADRFQTMAEFAETLADLEPTLAQRRTSGRGVQAVRRTTGRVSRTTGAATVEVPAAPAPETKTRITPFAMAKGIRFWSAAGLVVLLAAGVGVWRVWFHEATGAAEGHRGFDPRRIAITYFESRGGSDSLSYVADGLTEALINELSRVNQLQVISRNGVLPYKKTAASPDSIGRALKVGTVVEGTLERSGDRLRVNVSLINASTGAQIGSKTIERSRSEIFELQDELAQDVSVFLRQSLGRAVERVESRIGTRNQKAWELLQQAEQLTNDVDPLLASGDTAAAGRQLSRADSLLAQAESGDPKWVSPIVKRGWIAYRWTDLVSTFDRPYYEKYLELGLEYAERALKLKPDDPDALELRGTMEHWRWLLNLEPDASKAAALEAAAERDLRATVTANPNAAVAWSWLSHIYIGNAQNAEAKLAALRSYEADPYLSSAKLTVYRLFFTSLNLEDLNEAVHWCREGRERFPDYYRFTECQLWLYALKGYQGTISDAWRLLDEYVQNTAPNLRPYRRLYGQMLVAMALARAGLADSARAVAERSRGDASVDPSKDLAEAEAIVRTMLGDQDEALRLLSTYLAANPQMLSAMRKDQSWWWRDLRDDPRYKALLGGG